MFLLSRRAATLDHNSNRVGRPLWGMRDIRRNEKCFAFVHDVVHDPLAFANAHFDVALELVKILFRIDKMKIVPRVGPFDHHHEKVAPVIEITVAHWRFELFSVLFDPVL